MSDWEIPDELRADAIELPDDASDVWAWPKEAALALLDGLAGTKIAVLGFGVYHVDAEGPVETGMRWAFERLPFEPAADYAERSRSAARDAILGRPDLAPELYALDLSDQQGAA